MERIPCSIPILTLNAEKHLEECLLSLRDFADVFLVDGNSTDNTLAIAKRHGVPVYKQFDTDEPGQRITDFAAMRTRSFGFAKYPWIFYLDSDEYVSPEMVEDIRTIVTQNTSVKKAYEFQFCMIIGDTIVRHSFVPLTKGVHLFHKESGIYWKANKVVHEKLFIPDDVDVVRLPSVYFGYCPPYQESKEKDARYRSLMKAKILNPAQKKGSWRIVIRSLGKNVLQAVYICMRTVGVYLRYGFRESIPPSQAWRYIKTHLFISYYRLIQLIRFSL